MTHRQKHSKERIFNLHLSPHFASLSINPLVYWSPSPRPAADRGNEATAEYVNLPQEDRGTKGQNSKDFNQMFIVFCRKKISTMILPYFLLFFLCCVVEKFSHILCGSLGGCLCMFQTELTIISAELTTRRLLPRLPRPRPTPPPIYGAEKAEQSREDLPST